MNFLGFELWEEGVQELLHTVEEAIREGKKLHIVTLNPEMVARQTFDLSFRQVLQEAEVLIPDGVGIVWGIRFLERRVLERLAGIELAEEIVVQGEKKGWSFYFLGGEPGIAEQAARNLCRRYPRLRVVGFHHGYFGEDGEVVEDICGKVPDVLLVGMGSPRQEKWVHRYKDVLPSWVMIGVGGSLDVWSGKKKRAPRLWQTMRLEWGYRLLCEPWRIRRIVPSFLRFAWLLLREKFRKKRMI